MEHKLRSDDAPTRMEGTLPPDVRDALRTLALTEQNQRLTLAVQVGGLGVWDYDIPSDSMTCDGQWHRIMGLDPANPITSVDDFRRVIHPDDRERATEVEETARHLLSDRKDYGIVFRIVRPDEEIRWVRSAACIFNDTQSRPVRAVGYVVDITETRLAEQLLQDSNAQLLEENQSLMRQTLVDPLTAIANRRRLDQEVERACNHARSNGQSLAVLMIDIDYFKPYNDHYGHKQGDRALAGVAEAIATAAWRPYDLAARYGGEEFAVLLPGAVDPHVVIERIFDNVAALKLPHTGSPLSQLTISCGCVVTADPQQLDPNVLLDAADQRLYRAKQQGRNRYCVDTI